MSHLFLLTPNKQPSSIVHYLSVLSELYFMLLPVSVFLLVHIPLSGCFSFICLAFASFAFFLPFFWHLSPQTITFLCFLLFLPSASLICLCAYLFITLCTLRLSSSNSFTPILHPYVRLHLLHCSHSLFSHLFLCYFVCSSLTFQCMSSPQADLGGQR